MISRALRPVIGTVLCFVATIAFSDEGMWTFQNFPAGKVQEKVGEATGDRDTEAKGVGNQAEGKVQKTVGDVKDAVNNLRK